MQNRSLPVNTYEWLASAFNPIKFDAREWVALAKAAGVRYITITVAPSRRLLDVRDEGHALQHRRLDAVQARPAEGARRRMPAARASSSSSTTRSSTGIIRTSCRAAAPGKDTGRPESGDWNRYLDFMDAQLTELLTNYGPIGGIWFDGMWDKPDADWRLDRTYALIHRLQPAALIVPNHHKAPLPGEDVQTFEQDLPGANTAGFNTKEIGTLPLETSLTMNDSWGFNITDRNFKSVPRSDRLPRPRRRQRRQPAAEHRAAARRHDPARGRRAAAGDRPVAADVRFVDLRHAPRARSRRRRGARRPSAARRSSCTCSTAHSRRCRCRRSARASRAPRCWAATCQS